MENRQVLLKPIITEKSLQDASKGVYTFMVAKFADKRLIKHLLEDQFSIHIQTITTMNVKGKKRQIGKKRTKVSKPDWKKAKVQVKAGEKIGLFEAEAKG